MKPTEQEKQWLKEYLYQALTYRETFDEVYDHILLALEHKEAQPFFESTVYQIIDEDFGGSINMLNMEVECQITTNSEVKSQYWKIGRVYGDTKESIRDRAFRWLIYGFFLVSMFVLRPIFSFLNFIMMHSFHYQSPKAYGNSIPGHILSTMGLMIIIIHFLSLVKLYRDEFKTQMIFK
jgi:hypothetical protein